MSRAGYTSHRVEPGTTVTVGRGRDATIAIDDPSVSRQHARIAIAARGAATITDLGSANGTFLGGRPLAPHRPTPLGLGEPVALGKAIITVRDEDERRAQRDVLDGGALTAHLDGRCREAAHTSLAFRVACITVRDDVHADDVASALEDILGRADVLGRADRRDWVVVADDVPAGRAKQLVHDVADALRADGIWSTIGIARWPRDGRTAADLLAAARATQTRDADGIVHGQALAPVLEMADAIARSELSVLILGETGVGKEVLASRLHERSPRAAGPLVTINCAALSEQLVESELFGHVRGAFTGADHAKLGLLASANGGTVFLDEIGELPLAMQAKLLRALEDREVRQVGAVHPQPLDLRFVAATNQRLDDPARFRPDLYFRLSGAVLEIPPLRERTDEIVPLAQLFLRRYAEHAGIPTPALTPVVERLLVAYAWPGNVRELRNAIERAAILADGRPIEPHHLPLGAPTLATPPVGVPTMRHDPSSAVTQPGRQPDRDAIVRALAAAGGNQHRAAEQLGVHRRTLMRWMDLLKITRPRKSS